MLAGATLRLVAEGRTVSVVARRERTLARLTHLAAELPGIVRPCEVDWHDSVALRSVLDEARAEHGAIDLVVAWIHSTAPGAPFVVADAATADRNGDAPLAFYQLFGSYDEATADVRKRWQRDLAADDRFDYRQIHLGHVKTSHGPRWLTDKEISAGVIEALDFGAPGFPIGTVDGLEKPKRSVGWLSSLFKRRAGTATIRFPRRRGAVATVLAPDRSPPEPADRWVAWVMSIAAILVAIAAIPFVFGGNIVE